MVISKREGITGWVEPEVRNRFKGLDLIDTVPDELWMEVRDIVQEAGIKTIPEKKKCKKAKWLSEEVLQIAVKRREAKDKAFCLFAFLFLGDGLDPCLLYTVMNLRP